MATNPVVPTATHEHIQRVVGMLLARESRKQRHLAEMLDTTLQTANNKLRGATRFRVDEIQTLARIFQEDIGVFFDPSKPIGTVPVLPPVPDPGHGLLTWTFNALPQVRGYVLSLRYDLPKSAVFPSPLAA